MWFMLMAGKEAFGFENGELSLKLRPILPGRLFDGDGKVCFRFLGRTEVAYINAARRDTFGTDGVKPVKYVLTGGKGEAVELNGSVIPAPYAEAVRSGDFASITVHLG